MCRFKSNNQTTKWQLNTQTARRLTIVGDDAVAGTVRRHWLSLSPVSTLVHFSPEYLHCYATVNRNDDDVVAVADDVFVTIVVSIVMHSIPFNAVSPSLNEIYTLLIVLQSLAMHCCVELDRMGRFEWIGVDWWMKWLVRISLQSGMVKSSKGDYYIEPSKHHSLTATGHPHVIFQRSAVPAKVINLHNLDAKIQN